MAKANRSQNKSRYHKSKETGQRPEVTKRYRVLRFFLLSLLICVIVIAAWYRRSPKANFYFEVVTDYAVLELADRWTIPLDNHLHLKSLYTDNIDIEAFKEKNLDIKGEKNKIEETDVYLSALEINPDDKQDKKSAAQIHNATIELSSDASSLNLFVKGATILGEYNRNEKPAEMIPPETVYFKTKATLSSPTRMELTPFPDQAWNFADLKVTKIQFEKETQAGSAKFLSRVKAGKLRIIDSQKDIDLDWADNLRIDELTENRRMNIKQSPNGFKISFLGQAKILKAGPKGFEEDLRPRYLELFSSYAPIVLFIGAFSLIWSILQALLKEGQ